MCDALYIDEVKILADHLGYMHSFFHLPYMCDFGVDLPTFNCHLLCFCKLSLLDMLDMFCAHHTGDFMCSPHWRSYVLFIFSRISVYHVGDCSLYVVDCGLYVVDCASHVVD